MQGQPGIKAVDAYPFLGDLVTALCESPIYTTAAHETKNHMIKLALDKIGRVDEVQWLECRHYREHTPDQLELLFATLFNKTVIDGDSKSIHIFNAARRAIDSFAFGTSTHPSLCPRVSPRLEESRKRMREGQDASESDRGSAVTSKSRASVPAGSGSSADAADPSGTSPSRQPSAKREYVPDGTLRVKHPPELRRFPDVDKITGLTEKLYQKINALLHVASPFTFKNCQWVAMLDEAFIWMLHMQGSLSFSVQLRNKIHQLIFDTLKKLDNPVVSEAIRICPNGGWPVEVFVKQLKYRTHPPGPGAKKASMKRYGPVPKTPYTSPLIEENILEWDGKTELTLEDSSLKAGDQGYEMLPFANAKETPGPAAECLSFSAAHTLDAAGGSADAPRPAHSAPPAATSSSTSVASASALPWNSMSGGAPHVQPIYYLGQGAFPAVSLQWQDSTSVMGAGAATLGGSARPWDSLPPQAPKGGAPAGNSMQPPLTKRAHIDQGAKRAKAPAPAAAASPTPEPVRVIRAPEHLPVAVKQTLETLLIGRTVRSFQLLQEVNQELVEKDLCSLDAPYLVASVFKNQKNYEYWVGKPVAKYEGKLICWYPPSVSGQGTIETAGIFDQVQDITLAPTFVIKIIAEDGATDDAKHGDLARDAVQDYTAEGRTTKARKTALMKDTLAWLLAKCKIQGDQLASHTQKRMVRAMINIVINDPDTVTELQKSMPDVG